MSGRPAKRLRRVISIDGKLQGLALSTRRGGELSITLRRERENRNFRILYMRRIGHGSNRVLLELSKFRP